MFGAIGENLIKGLGFELDTQKIYQDKNKNFRKDFLEIQLEKNLKSRKKKLKNKLTSKSTREQLNDEINDLEGMLFGLTNIHVSSFFDSKEGAEQILAFIRGGAKSISKAPI